MQLALIAVAGAAGALLRYGVARLVLAVGEPVFPIATLAVNVTGSFAIGFLATFLVERTGMSAELRVALLVGLLGSYTTFSTFSFETLQLMQVGEWTQAALNAAVSLAGALAAVWAGQTLARQ